MSLGRLRLPVVRVLSTLSSTGCSTMATVTNFSNYAVPHNGLQSCYCKTAFWRKISVRPFSSESESVIFNIENDEEFSEKVISSSSPVLVDFYADWCGPCKMLGPRLEAKIKGCEGAVLLAKVNVDFAADLAMEYGVNAVPTLVAFKNGEVVARMEGDNGDDYLDQLISNLSS